MLIAKDVAHSIERAYVNPSSYAFPVPIVVLVAVVASMKA